ncbi:hypothetical protein Cgig2_021711 [Carnegiea gigantea]|uniref:DUF8040 domain-containing protein n=1 Tax=Carnegiea gigantea TaxID=171969 RepID=A0A9Q1GME2_9CARY|nr:hypothetical protein Cgig2_021711 [Carnegiea gigantea]
MAASGKKFANWTKRDDEKLFDILVKQRAQGSVKFKWSLVRVMLKNEGINKEGAQIKNRFHDLGKKLRAWCWCGLQDYGCRSVGFSLGRFLSGGSCKLGEVKSIFYDKHATGEMSFLPGMVASLSNHNQKSKGKAIDMEEHVGDSDEANEDGSDVEIKCLGVEESRSPPKSVHISRGNSSDRKRQELLDWSSRDEEVQQALAILCMRDESRQQPSLIKQVQAQLKEHLQISAMESDFIWSVMDYIKKHKEQRFFLDLDDEFVVRYVTSRGMFSCGRPCFTLKEKLPRAIGGESGTNYIHRLLYGNRPNLCHKVLRLDRHIFIHLISMFMERGVLIEGPFIKAAEIVAITLFILARGASYREAEYRFHHSLSTIGKYHKQVLGVLILLGRIKIKMNCLLILSRRRTSVGLFF